MSEALAKYTEEQQKLLWEYVAKDLNNDEMSFFLNFCEARGLNPLLKEIYGIVRFGKGGKRQLSIQTSIDGFRSLAETTGEYRGQTPPEWTDGALDDHGKVQWYEAWVSEGTPVAARVGILREGFAVPVFHVAHFAEFSTDEFMWKKMPANQIVKCAEAGAFRKAFPRKFGQLYVHEEMEQADRRAQEPPAATSTKDKVADLANRAQRAWGPERTPATTIKQELPLLEPGKVLIGGSTKWADKTLSEVPMELVSWLAANSKSENVKIAAQRVLEIEMEREQKRLEDEENRTRADKLANDYERPDEAVTKVTGDYDPTTGEVKNAGSQ